MVNFSKQYEEQLVPEWKVAFVDYRELKEVLKKIQALQSTEASIKQKESPLSTTIFSSIRNLNLFGHHHHHRDHGPIQVHKKPASSASKGEFYETELLEQFADVEAVSEFFSCLDHQLNKVNQFYRSKEKEFLERGESLKKQVDILIELETELKKQRRVKGVSYQDDPSISCHIPCDEDFTEKTEQQVEEEQEQEEQGQDSNTEGCEKNDHQHTQPSKPDDLEASPGINKEDFNSRVHSGRTFNYQGKNLKLNIPLTTPSRTFSALGYLIKEDLINQSSRKCSPRTSKIHVNKTRLQHAGKTIRGALIELYKGLSYLETYRNLNVMAFAKILEKLDKVINKQVLPVYLKVVQTSYFNTSNEVMRLMEEAEKLFIKHFANDNRQKAMEYLKPSQRKESHWVSFFNGIFTGCFLALLAGYIIMAHMAGMYKQSSDTIYMETVYPVFSIFSLLFLHFFLYGCNIFMWRKARINYCFIFELASTKELKYREVFLICTASMTAIVGVLFIHITLEAKGYSSNQSKAVPGVILMFFTLLLVCPFNVVYKTSRYRFVRVIKNIVFSPLYKVVMLDFFMADQLCSQVPLLRNLEYVACYYLTGSYKTQDYRYCVRNTYYRDLAYAVSFLPYYWRAMQCARRWFDEGEISHLTNLGKYVSAMLAAGAKVAYEKDSSVGYLCLVVAISSGATMYQLYWDFVKDWGLLQFDSRNPWLRNELMLRQKSIYYFSMGLNFVLRLVWLQTVLHLNFGGVDHRVTALLLAALEVIRRGQWNFYRLENEHLNNAGKFRAVKTVPLPFHEVDEED